MENLHLRFKCLEDAFDFDADNEFPERFDQIRSLLEKCATSENALMELAEFEELNPVVTGGPLSGSGVSLYHSDFTIVEDLTCECSEILEQVREGPDEAGSDTDE